MHAIYYILFFLISQLLCGYTTIGSDLSSLSYSGQTLFHTALSYSDGLYDLYSGYLFASDPTTPGQYDTRSSAMYAVGLLLRNGNDGEDVNRATRTIELIAKSQYGLNMQSEPWFGTYPHSPGEIEPFSRKSGLIRDEFGRGTYSRCRRTLWQFDIQQL